MPRRRWRGGRNSGGGSTRLPTPWRAYTSESDERSESPEDVAPRGALRRRRLPRPLPAAFPLPSRALARFRVLRIRIQQRCRDAGDDGAARRGHALLLLPHPLRLQPPARLLGRGRDTPLALALRRHGRRIRPADGGDVRVRTRSRDGPAHVGGAALPAPHQARRDVRVATLCRRPRRVRTGVDVSPDLSAPGARAFPRLRRGGVLRLPPAVERGRPL